MKVKVKHGGAVRCDDVFVDAGDNWKDECPAVFLSYSLPSLTRAQAKNVGWQHVKAKLVRWRGNPPAGPGKKVDLCPAHTHLIMSPEEYEKHKKDERERKKAERELQRKAARAEAKKKAKEQRDAAKAAKPKKPRKKKAKAEETPF